MKIKVTAQKDVRCPSCRRKRAMKRVFSSIIPDASDREKIRAEELTVMRSAWQWTTEMPPGDGICSKCAKKEAAP